MSATPAFGHRVRPDPRLAKVLRPHAGRRHKLRHSIRPSAVCVVQTNGRGKCVPIAAAGASCADPSAAACSSPELCDAGICAESPSSGGLLATCASDADCGGNLCRPALDRRKRCLRNQEVGGICLGPRGILSFAACRPGTACGGRSEKCLTKGVTLPLGESCSVDDFSQLGLCDRDDSSNRRSARW